MINNRSDLIRSCLTIEQVLENQTADINTKIALAMIKKVGWSLMFSGEVGSVDYRLAVEVAVAEEKSAPLEKPLVLNT